MERLSTQARPNWTEIVEAQGFMYHSLGGPYWLDDVCYRFSPGEVQRIEQATAELHLRCLEAVQHVIRNDWFERLAIPERDRHLIIESWEADEPDLYGRFDFCFDGASAPRLYEYNADTPTSLLEGSIIQRRWRDDRFPGAGQFNFLHERLTEAWAGFGLEGKTVHFSAAANCAEDHGNVEYLRGTAAAAGLRTKFLTVQELRWDKTRGRFVDRQSEPIEVWFKLYPWEQLLAERYGEHLHRRTMRLIEPAWKMVLSNKGILPVLWELFPGHPNLLPAYTTPEPLGDTYVRKPLFGREGSNISIHFKDRSSYVPGRYGKDPVIYQQYCPLPEFDNRHAVVGSWVINSRPAGIGIRESARLISENRNQFVPHIVA